MKYKLFLDRLNSNSIKVIKTTSVLNSRIKLLYLIEIANFIGYSNRMKQLTFLIILSSFFIQDLSAQDPQSQNVNLLYHAFDESLEVNYRDSRYSEIWGFTEDERDYAVIACTYGHYIYDITDPVNTYLADSVAGVVQGFSSNWRDYHDYNGYLYAVDDSGPSGLQIMDISTLPVEATLVYESDTLFSKAHNIFIDTAAAILYLCGADIGNLALFSLENPTDPELIGIYNDWNYIHDTYVKNGIAYLDAAWTQKLHVVDFSDPYNPVELGNLSGYPDAGATHSGWLSDDEQTYVLIDETYNSDIKTVDVSDFTDMTALDVFAVDVDSAMAHNVMIKGDHAYVSYYNSGFQLFDISDPTDVQRVAWYDTYDGGLDGGFRGAWGVYVFTDKNKVIISDRLSGLYVLEVDLPVPSSIELLVNEFRITPNPINEYFKLDSELEIENVRLMDMNGRVFYLENDDGIYNTSQLAAGNYILSAQISGQEVLKKIIIIE